MNIFKIGDGTYVDLGAIFAISGIFTARDRRHPKTACDYFQFKIHCKLHTQPIIIVGKEALNMFLAFGTSEEERRDERMALREKHAQEIENWRDSLIMAWRKTGQ